jgi:hypothetical protein
MPNPLDGMGGPPIAPNPDAGNALQQGAPQQQQAAPTAPSHSQVVAALRHYDAIKSELSILLRNPALGKSDLKGAIIDGTSKLVGERFISPADAVMQLSKVPSAPLEQRKWLQGLMNQATQNEIGILNHHRNTNLGSGDWAVESQQHNSDPDNHMQDMQALAANYGPK